MLSRVKKKYILLFFSLFGLLFAFGLGVLVGGSSEYKDGVISPDFVLSGEVLSDKWKKVGVLGKHDVWLDSVAKTLVIEKNGHGDVVIAFNDGGFNYFLYKDGLLRVAALLSGNRHKLVTLHAGKQGDEYYVDREMNGVPDSKYTEGASVKKYEEVACEYHEAPWPDKVKWFGRWK